MFLYNTLLILVAWFHTSFKKLETFQFTNHNLLEDTIYTNVKLNVYTVFIIIDPM